MCLVPCVPLCLVSCLSRLCLPVCLIFFSWHVWFLVLSHISFHVFVSRFFFVLFFFLSIRCRSVQFYQVCAFHCCLNASRWVGVIIRVADMKLALRFLYYSEAGEFWPGEAKGSVTAGKPWIIQQELKDKSTGTCVLERSGGMSGGQGPSVCMLS